MPWSERSFMVETKPQADYASLYVACIDSDPRDIVRIVHNGIDLCSSDELAESHSVADSILDQLAAVSLTAGSSCEDGESSHEKAEPAGTSAPFSCDQSCHASNFQKIGLPDHEPVLEHSEALCAVISGIKMDPESVKNFAWTEDRQTFACKLKIELVDQHNSKPRSWYEAVKSVRTCMSGMESYCDCLNDCDVILQCNNCCQVLHKADELRGTKFYKLPSVEFNEVMDELFCHQHEKDVTDKNVVYSYFINGPRPNQCFVGGQYLLMNSDLFDKCFLTESNMVCCPKCRRCLGCVDMMPAYRYFPKKNAFRFNHIAVNLIGRERSEINPDSTAKNFFDLRYESKEQFFSWLVLSECESYSTLYFVIKTLDSHPKLMIWILDAFTVMALGKLSETTKHSFVHEEDKYKPFPAVKLLYKKLTDRDMNDPFVNGQHTGVGSLTLPEEACNLLLKFLETSSLEMPISCRSLGNFAVGFLPLASEF